MVFAESDLPLYQVYIWLRPSCHVSFIMTLENQSS